MGPESWLGSLLTNFLLINLRKSLAQSVWYSWFPFGNHFVQRIWACKAPLQPFLSLFYFLFLIEG